MATNDGSMTSTMDISSHDSVPFSTEHSQPSIIPQHQQQQQQQQQHHYQPAAADNAPRLSRASGGVKQLSVAKDSGKRKIQIRRIENERARAVTFSKRKNGLLKKAMELAVLCDCEVSVMIFTKNGKLVEFSSEGSHQKMMERYANYSGLVEHREINKQTIKTKVNMSKDRPADTNAALHASKQSEAYDQAIRQAVVNSGNHENRPATQHIPQQQQQNAAPAAPVSVEFQTFINRIENKTKLIQEMQARDTNRYAGMPSQCAPPAEKSSQQEEIRSQLQSILSTGQKVHTDKSATNQVVAATTSTTTLQENEVDEDDQPSFGPRFAKLNNISLRLPSLTMLPSNMFDMPGIPDDELFHSIDIQKQ
eukprot:CAMPEP_0184696892 /NCGR_PEP_ID=MMETSP0313-20130426/4048_1 /TAXON_ID=2792 /ORGANISM="Porphyridium aerugineum, Strain SAG 1380-2" /LENGTH=364 /DNA_ID=CAMNT_0027155613 /DNA_START=134 /DNA_END=1228 /DNA_ORIENTATION=-